jgi:hypothetical protein
MPGIRRPVVSVLTSAVLVVGSCSPIATPRAAPAPAVAVSGFYEGEIHSQRYGDVPVSANLRNEEGRLAGTLITPLGDFPITQETLTSDQLTLQFVVGDGDVGTISGQWSVEEIRGTWELSDDGGAVSLRRVGPARAPVEPAGVRLDLSTSEWREDLHHLALELPGRHGDAFHRVAREEFEDSIQALDGRLASLDGHEVFAAMGRIVAMVGDGHTYLQLPGTFRRYPLRQYAFGDTLRITHAAAGYEPLLGARVLAIGGTEIREAARLVRRQIAPGENEWYVLKELPWFLIHAEVLHAHGVVPDLEEAQWTVETVSGERMDIRLAPVALGEGLTLVSAAQAVPLYRRRADEDLSFTFLQDSRTLYVNFRGYPPRDQFREFFDDLFEFADQHHAERLVIDLRQNSGGDFTKGRELLLPRLIPHRLNQHGRLFVAIGRHTFSAAMTNAADFSRETNATLVGEPTGARPNGWQEKGEFTLPNSRLTVSVSTRYYRFLDEDLPAVMPHRQVDLTWEDFRAGRDPVLDWIVAQPLP